MDFVSVATAAIATDAAHRFAVRNAVSAAQASLDADRRAAARAHLQDLGRDCDGAGRWLRLTRELEQSRSSFHEAQSRIRSLVPSDGAAVGEEVLDAAVRSRDERRAGHLERLRTSLEQHERFAAAAQHSRLLAELQALETDPGPAAMGAGLTGQVRLSMLRERLVPPLDEWVGLVPRLQDELAELEAAGSSAPGLDDLHRLRDAWYEAEDALDRLLEQRPTRVRAGRPQPPPVPQAQLAAATRAVQQSERSLRAERARLSGMAASHFPELAVKEPLLQLGAAEGELFQRGGMLVERSLEQYSGPGGASSLEVLADLLSARHRVLRGEFGLDAHGRGVPCVLKEYVLDGEGVEWGKLVREVSVLAKLSDSPRFVEVQAVFQQARAGQNLAYLQLPYFEKRDVCHWLESDPPPSTDERRKMLRQLAEALQHLHSHGYAHGDVKLENVLMSAQATAHLADFESVREEPAPSAVRSASRSAGGGVRTMRYVAPERRSGQPGMSKPSAASDMYAYGVCALLACCDGEGEGEVVFDAAEQLRGWSREAASSAGGPHLPALLDALLDLEQPAATSVMDALARRLSAKQVPSKALHFKPSCANS
ncbi:hypothetical protein EMIHUDRAFT_250980 [Emiliania huxleyi CCMP1516]|uniref:Protein kinase domain-containing protein n=2 Tax=Emiliania huxleyi TaxID=2903 RepID=A0A0D3KYV5_EMIH1|nr:hypothetical protein EMIHUDRAFT_250980 [Emiliania huxleyi CCMP1516]EOD40940.1 hypothetical protein EMIHUDRAFT_250980 [Emiliania huxleyi CCMP1516]|eukprot:XP_005793369.1 hypothetical protein EMIHUDRAFT_250980 [Emiliania huxleyi CCMP1516]